jgi:tRNA pseudouridine38-40 synthase
MRRIRLTIAYDGSRWHGWQAGRSGMGVADRVRQALEAVFPGAGELVSSSRTDSGVHALGLVAHADLPENRRRIAETRIAAAVNARLPSDIRVIEAAGVPNDFHARFDAVAKQYRYRIWNAPVMNPLIAKHAWHVPQALDVDAMRAAASRFAGSHDFRAFTSRRDGVPASTTRTIRRLEVRDGKPDITLLIEADGFLYKMCRAIAGTMVRIGRGAMNVSELDALLTDPNRRTPGMNAPAHGLTLWSVAYPPLPPE